MKKAQICPHCKECFITNERLAVCPFCDKDIPQKKKQTSKPVQQKATLEGASIDELQAALAVLTKQEISTVEPSTDVIKEFLTVNDKVHQIYNLVYGFLSKNNELLKSKTLSNEVLCDFGFFCREMAAIFDELRKEANARKDLCGQIIAYRLTQAVISDPSLKMKTKGQFASGSPDCKLQTALPKKFTDDYYKITDFLGVPRNVAESGVLRLDWKQVTEFLTQRMNDGKPIPEGFGKQYPVYTTTYRKIKRANKQLN